MATYTLCSGTLSSYISIIYKDLFKLFLRI
nr:MAG TPA: hypothetical protein [Caudoviricetes sp.]